MLQQTQVNTVIPYYQRWLKQLPTVAALATAEEQTVLSLWQGLGYYSRARNLRAAAQRLVRDHNGQLPRDVNVLRTLPGVGAYTAGAIASIAYEQNEPLVDGNVIRVLTRLFALAGDPTRRATQAAIWEHARKLIVPGRARDFNQGLMELGALVCTKTRPLCADCPLRQDCVAFRRGEMARFPESRPRPKVTPLHHAALLIRSEDSVLLEHIADDAPRWAGLYRLPTVEHPGTDPLLAAQRLLTRILGSRARVQHLDTLTHSVTRYRVTLQLFTIPTVSAARPAKLSELRWTSLTQGDRLPMTGPHRKLWRRHVT